MEQKLKPIVERANVVGTLQAIRRNLMELQESNRRGMNHALQEQRLRHKVDELMKEYVFLVVDNT